MASVLVRGLNNSTRARSVSAFLTSQIFSDKIGQSDCVYLRKSCEVPILSNCG
jgi:hypothetical protein